MESEGGGIAVAAARIIPRRLSSSQRSTLLDTFIASDLAERSNNDSNSTSPRHVPNVSNVTLGAVLNRDKKSPPRNNAIVRTLLEIIHNDEPLSIGGGLPSNSKMSWKSFREKLKCRKGQSRNTCRRAPQSDVLPNQRSGEILSDRNNSLGNNSLRRVDDLPAVNVSLVEVGGGSFRLSAVLAAEREQTRRRLSRELDDDEIDVTGFSGQGNGHEDVDGNVEVANQPVRMSLMDLLEETDLQTGISGPTYGLGDDDEDGYDEHEETVVEELGKEELSCCVCMVRHKGAAFIPCGHTFCRLCCRELFAQRGNCPLCNNPILEILNIF